MRKLVSVQAISNLSPIEGADRIEVATIKGWKVVVGKGLYNEGDLVAYCEIDSWLPHDLAPELSKGKEPRVFGGVEGERLRTIKLRGAVSQGYVIPLSVIEEFNPTFSPTTASVGDDLTELVGVVKWERPLPTELSGQAKGNFPHYIPKTDQERAQNLVGSYDFSGKWEVTLKMDGSSLTLYTKDGEVGVCSRNLELKDNEDNNNNAFIRMARKLDYVNTLKDVASRVGFDFAIQGELMGVGIQGNREGFDDLEFFVYDIYDITNQTYLSPEQRQSMMYELGDNWRHVPIVNDALEFERDDVDYFLEMANIPSYNHDIAEGVVFKHESGMRSFKAINNLFLLKGGD